MAMLPEFEVPDSFIVPTAMVFTYHAGGGQAQTRGRGAPLSKRILYDVLTALPQDGRLGQGKWRLEFTLRDLRDWLYTSVEVRPTSFKMGRHLERIRAALWEVGNMRIEQDSTRQRSSVSPAANRCPRNARRGLGKPCCV